MKTIEQLADGPEINKDPRRQEGRLDPIWGRIDLMAILVTVLAFCLFGIAAFVLAAVDFIKLVCGLWSDSYDRWLLASLGLGLVWLAVRWRKWRPF